MQVTGQEKSFDGLHWFADASKHFKEVLQSLEESKVADQPKNSSFAGLKLWGQAASQPSPISAETQKVTLQFPLFMFRMKYFKPQ